MEKSRIYTKTGDKGFTSLVGGKRVSKTNIRLEAYGTVDELNAFIGLLIEGINDRHDLEVLLQIQSTLFSVGAYLATDDEEKKVCCVGESEIEHVESEIDRLDAYLPKLSAFVLPGGSKGAALAHVCRTVCRRAERRIYEIPNFQDTDNFILIYMNRLSDYFFILARKECFDEKGQEIIWQNPCK